MRVLVGVHVHAQPQRLQATLAALRDRSPAVDLVLLPDGPDVETARAVRATGLPVLGTTNPQGVPACFNRLIASDDAPLLVLLESGAVVAPGWLEELQAALDGDPANGLAGPSTNSAWNEQAVLPSAGGSARELVAAATSLRRRFRGTWRTLEPLYSLADFCYAVRREVVETIGAADEAFGRGPCWEMDYNVRAARAGFAGVWAQSAYVWRAPFTARRAADEAAGFDASRRLYQDHFCALRLRGGVGEYEPHCRGEACAHFAPAELVNLRLALPGGAPARAITVVSGATAPPTPAPRPPGGRKAPDPGPAAVRELPLVTCLMPTRDRAPFALRAVEYFLRQDWPERELLVLDDGQDGLELRLPADTRIRHIRVARGMSIGEKRNRGIDLARGEFLAQWDDDDWYAPARLSAQLAPLLQDAADISALTAGVWADLPTWSFWRCTPALHRRLFRGDVHGGTLVFRRSLWLAGAHYPDASLAEDAAFLMEVLRRRARLARLPGDDLFVYVRHGRNSWALDQPPRPHAPARGWLRVPEPALLSADRGFYLERAAALGAPVTPAPDRARPTPAPVVLATPAPRPLVSCIMPTADRAAFVPRALEYFERQSYPERELIVLDDGPEPIGHLVAGHPRVRYLRLDPRRSVGWKRNRACAEARGEFVVHWDDDDWSAPWRLEYQVGALLDNPGRAACGLSKVIFWEPATARAWEYDYPPNAPHWVAGGTLAYRRDAWREKPFADVRDGEDTRWVWGLRPGRLLALPNSDFFVALVHPGNTSPKRTSDRRWRPIAVADVLRRLGDDVGCYAPAAPAPLLAASG